MNYDLEMQNELRAIGGEKPRLLLHACCAPCSTVALERIAEHFDLTVYYYNPNIYPETEHDKRLGELRRLLSEAPFARGVGLATEQYDTEEFICAVRGLESEPEGGARCLKCFELRLIKAAETAAQAGYEYLAATITTGPRKNAAAVNEIGERAAQAAGVKWLPADFKKRGGYQRSVELSKQLGLYRQDYCGCSFSLREKPENGGAVL